MLLDHLVHMFELPLSEADALRMGDDGLKPELRLAIRVAHVNVHS